ncbi:Ig-like domain-containing protein [Clostridium botulinum]|uniref:DUF11 domain-containing protein n=3 Tax=Clostridium botulinum TaxID=1491 RepID=A0A9Q1ZB07_CLOBO|nr:DUF11 domain-containing protein [Clostridium botulinum]AEB75644.1 repeat domain protein [Clostridium botulinum BKT015925]KEI01649.1 hypothetical protein Y848_09310 [Clostridium botulinum C/D str. Sp77]KLU76751.1 hypothetical protein CBC3_02025 [Clostridium botulinum V891]KOA73966.1 hypothetical protein ADU77_12965 [Clostridium botulinum]KOA76397.1 hypothetical protein ADU78_06130 [Clostridium botulinum]
MPNNLIFSKTINGGITFTGNSIGLSKKENSQNAGTANSIGALMASNLDYLQVPTYPPYTTLNYLVDSSTAILKIPKGCDVAFTALSWGGCCKVPGENRISPVSNNVRLRAVDPSFPTEYIFQDRTYFTDKTKDVVFYNCYAIVTNEIKKSMSAEYSVAEFPVTSEATDNSNNCGGWTLAVVYTSPYLPARSISIYTGLEEVTSSNPFSITTSFSQTPKSTTQIGRVLLSAMHASATLGNNKVLFGPNEYNLVPLSGPRNLTNHFFGSQINDDNENIDTSGTFGDRNQDILSGTNMIGGRQGWDITNVDASPGLTNFQTSGIFKFVTTNNNYLLNLFGLQIDIEVPQLSIDKTVLPLFASIGDVVEYTISIPNNTSTTFNNLVLTDTFSNEISYVSNSLTINGSSSSDSPVTGVTLGNLPPSRTILVKFKANVNSASSNNFNYLNYATLNYKVGTAPNIISASTKSNINKLYSSSIIIRPNITITANPDMVSLKDIVEYTININNTTTSTIENIILINYLPHEFSYVDNSLTINGISINSNLETGIDLGTINSWQTIIVKFKASANSKPNSGSQYTDSAILNYKFNTDDGLLPYSITTVNDIEYLVGGDIPEITNINKTASPIFASVGDIVEYTVSIPNNTSTTFKNLVLIYTLSKEISYVSNSLTINEVSSNDSPITGVTLGNIPPSKTILVKFKAKINSQASNNFYYVNSATVNYAVGTTPNIISATSKSNINKLYSSSIIIKPNMNINSNPTIVSLDDIVEYIININNDTTDTIKNVILTNSLPNEFSYILNSLSINNISVSSNPEDGIYIGSINSWQTITIKFKAKVNSKPTNTNLQYTDFANLSYKFNTDDGLLSYTITSTNTINYQSGSTIPEITDINKSVSPTFAYIGDIVEYTISIPNNTSTTFNNLVLIDDLSTEFSYVPNSLTINGTPSSSSPITGVKLGNLTPSQILLVKFKAKINSHSNNNFYYMNFASVNYEIGSPPNSISATSKSNINKLYSSSILVKPNINITANSTMVSINNIVECTITINNTTPNIISDAFLTNKLPTEFSYVLNSLTINDVLVNNTINNGITLDSINPWQTIIVKFKTQVNSEPNDINSQYTDSTTLSYRFNTSDGLLPYIITTSNTVNSLDVYVSPIVSKTAISSNSDPNVANIGDTINYTITIKNPSNKTIKNIILKDSLPNGLSIKSDSLTVNQKPISGYIETGIVLGDISSNGSIITNFVAEVSRFAYTNSAIVNYEFLSPNNTLLNSSVVATNNIYCDNTSNSYPPDLKPITFNNEKIIYKNTSITGAITSITFNNDNLKYRLFKSPKNGYAKIDMNGTWKYTPKVNFIGSDELSILIHAGDSSPSISKITILIKDFPNSFNELHCCKNNI